MSESTTATYENGVLRPHVPLNLPSGTRVSITVTPLDPDQARWDDLEKLWDEASVDSGGRPLTRDELHDRR